MSEMDFQAAQAQAQLTKHTEPLVWPIVVYALGLAAWIFILPGIVGLIIAHVKAGDADPISLTHYRYQMRTFWYSLIPTIIALVLTLIYIGWLFILLICLWGLVRQIKGLLYAIDRKPMPNPTTWLW